MNMRSSVSRLDFSANTLNQFVLSNGGPPLAVAKKNGREKNKTVHLVFKVLLVILTMAFFKTSFAACTYFGNNSGAITYAVSPATVTIPDSLPVGATLPVTIGNRSGGTSIYCSGAMVALPFGTVALNTPLTKVSGFSDVFATGYQGIGIRFHLCCGLGTLTSNTSAGTGLGGGGGNAPRYIEMTILVPGDVGRYELVKTGPIPAGTVASTKIATNLGTNIQSYPQGGSITTLVAGPNAPMDNYVIGSFKIALQTPTCSLSTNNATFDMGTLSTAAFTGGPGTHLPSPSGGWVADQSLISAGCNASTVAMTFAGTAAAAPYNKAFANAGSARGVALELWQKNGTQVTPNSSTPINFSPQGAGGRYTFSARYLQTEPTVTAGTVNARVTVTVNYK